MPVLVTRPARDAQRWVERLRERGVAAEALPLLAIVPAPDAQALRLARDSLPGCAAAMFVSANAVHGFLDQGGAWPEGVRAWAPGPATADALRERGVPAGAIDAPHAEASQFDSESLWTVVAGQLGAGDRLLLVRGADATGRSQGREWLAARLAESGVQVDVVCAYGRALPAWTAQQHALAQRAAGPDGLWLFSSSEAAANLRTLLPGAAFGQARALATHPRIAQAVRALGFGDVRESRPAFDDVVASIESFR
ncbi:MAG: uroporphyrinogen-III synthase [Comamonadaceae bacterium]|nr:MAG: uroporphyrinogen-III synthase [Comamonadaceae bacterium]